MYQKIVIMVLSLLDSDFQHSIMLNSSPAGRFSPAFWEEIKQLLGPIFGPIFDPIVVPILDALSMESYRIMIIDMLVWTFVIIAGLAFLAYEAPIIMAIFAPEKRRRPSSSTTTVRATSAQRTSRTPESRRIPRTSTVPVRPVRREIEGVSVKARMSLQGDLYTLEIKIHNGAEFPMKMALVELKLPVGIDTEIGTLRMQRLGEIGIGESRECIFQLISRGGNIEDLRGYVEFMSDSYEAARIPIPRMVKKKKKSKNNQTS